MIQIVEQRFLRLLLTVRKMTIDTKSEKQSKRDGREKVDKFRRFLAQVSKIIDRTMVCNYNDLELKE